MIDLSGMQDATTHPAWSFSFDWRRWCAEVAIWQKAVYSCGIRCSKCGAPLQVTPTVHCVWCSRVTTVST